MGGKSEPKTGKPENRKTGKPVKIARLKIPRNELESYGQPTDLLDLRDDPEAWLRHANDLASMGNSDAAIEILRTSLKRQPTHRLTLKTLAQLYIDHDLVNDAIDIFEKANRAKHQDPNLLIDQAEMLEELGYSADALKRYTEAVEKFPSSRIAALSFAKALERMGDPSHAEEYFKRAIDRATDSPRAWNELGRFYLRLDWLTKAENHYREAYDVFPTSPEIASWYASVLEKQEKHLEALKVLEKATERAPRYRPIIRQRRRLEEIIEKNDTGLSNDDSSPTEEPEISERSVDNDIRAIHDGSSLKPKLGFDGIADKIVSFLEELKKDGAPEKESKKGDEMLVCIGLFGPWGAGKSTLINALKSRFEHSGTKYPVVTVNPWKWNGKGEAHDFVRKEVLNYVWREVREKLPRWRRYLYWIFGYGNRHLVSAELRILARHYGEAALLTLVALGGLALTWWWASPAAPSGSTDLGKLAGGGAILTVLLGLVKVFSKNLIEGVTSRRQAYRGEAGLALAYQDIADLHGEIPLVLFIDDLDRCPPDRVAQFMESVHSLTAAGCITFIACDEEYVAAALNARYKDIIDHHSDGERFGHRFLEKIVQIPFRVPALDGKGLYELGLAVRPEETPSLDQPSLQTNEPPSTPNPDDSTELDGIEVVEGTPEKQVEPVNSVRLREIVGELLHGTVEPLALNVRQVKSLSNTLKLYLDIADCRTEAQARQLATFLFADRVDPEWLDALFHGEGKPDSDIGQLPELPERLREMIGEDQKDLLSMYRLIGRRPKRAKTGDKEMEKTEVEEDQA